MRSRFPVLALLAALAMAAGLPARAEIAAAAAERSDEPVRVYTNADLERLGPIPTQEAEPPTPEEVARRWEFVQSVLDQAYARIDADRRHDLDRRLTDARADALDRESARPRYVLPYSYGYGFGYGPGHGVIGVGRGRRSHPAASRLWERPNAEQFRPITPIHARPYPSNLFRLEARKAAAGATARGHGARTRP